MNSSECCPSCRESQLRAKFWENTCYYLESEIRGFTGRDARFIRPDRREVLERWILDEAQLIHERAKKKA